MWLQHFNTKRKESGRLLWVVRKIGNADRSLLRSAPRERLHGLRATTSLPFLPTYGAGFGNQHHEHFCSVLFGVTHHSDSWSTCWSHHRPVWWARSLGCPKPALCSRAFLDGDGLDVVDTVARLARYRRRDGALGFITPPSRPLERSTAIGLERRSPASP
jgi:hypothetical protein